MHRDSIQPLDPVLVMGLAQELVQLPEGQDRWARIARGYLAEEIEVVTNEDSEVPRESPLVDADEVSPLPSPREQPAPLSDRDQSDRIDPVTRRV